MAGRNAFLRIAPSLALLVAAGVAFGPGCSLGEGTGSAVGWLNVPECWSGPFDLRPDFFAAVPALPSLLIRVQNGGDYESFSDGLSFVVDDIGQVRGAPDAAGAVRPSLLGARLVVGPPPSVTAPGVPVVPVADPSIVHATLYLQRTCRTQNAALYATTVALDPNDPQGTCLPLDGGVGATPCERPPAIVEDAGPDASGSSPLQNGAPASVDSAASPSVGMSTIVFHSLFDGNEDEPDASRRLSWADFDLYFADPREACPGGLGPPPPCRGHVTGSFKFYFERGRPAQPFP